MPDAYRTTRIADLNANQSERSRKARSTVAVRSSSPEYICAVQDMGDILAERGGFEPPKGC